MNQNDHIALNKAHEHIKELQYSFYIAEFMKIRLKNNLSETQLKHCVTTENLTYKYWMHEKAEQKIKYIWKVYYCLQNIFMTVKIKADDFLKFNEEFFDITEIVLDNEWK